MRVLENGLVDFYETLRSDRRDLKLIENHYINDVISIFEILTFKRFLECRVVNVKRYFKFFKFKVQIIRDDRRQNVVMSKGNQKYLTQRTSDLTWTRKWRYKKL